MGMIIDNVREAVQYIREQYAFEPEAGIILGSGLGNLKREMEIEKEIPYDAIPHFPVATVEGHDGTLILGKLSGRRVVAMAGRFHFYEGYSAQEVVFPVRVMKFLGIRALLLSNAAGGVHPAFRIGDLMIIRDHISLYTVNPLLGPNEPELGVRFPDMSEPYDKALIKHTRDIAARLGYPIRTGVYFGVTGPTFETRAEYKLIHLMGGDAVGMSTVQEVIAAVHMGLRVLGISIITDLGLIEGENKITHEEVLEAAAAAEPKMTAIFKELVKQL